MPPNQRSAKPIIASATSSKQRKLERALKANLKRRKALAPKPKG